MNKGYVKVTRTPEGKYYGQVRLYNGRSDMIRYETPEYLTKDMANTDAACWKAFHMTDETPAVDYDINADDTVRTHASRNGTPNNTWTASEFAEKLTQWQTMFPELTFRAGKTTGSGHVAKGEDFFIAIRKTPTTREAWYIVKKP